MPDNFDRRKGFKPSPQARPNQDQRKPSESPKRGDRGPYFLPKLLGQEITIHLVTGQEIKGRLKGFNSYELLIESTDSDEVSLVFRSAIAKITFGTELMRPTGNKQ
ncbi:MAG: RNA chaperone Hfq [Methanotrichaceae archaeon]